MNIVFVCHEYPPPVEGGIGAAVATLARGLARQGHDVRVIGCYLRPVLQVLDGVRVHRLPMPSPKVPVLRLLRARIRLRHALKALHRERPIEIVEWPDYEGWFLRPIRGVTDVIKVHGTALSHSIHGFAPPLPRLEAFELAALRKIRYWIGVSEWFANEWVETAGATPRLRTTVYNPVETSLFRPRAEGREPGRVLYVGGLKRRKGVLSLARAAPKLFGSGLISQLTFIGHESDLRAADLRGAAGSAGDRLDIRPPLPQEEIAKLMASAGVYAMPSFYESCGNGWIEAMACGVPVVGTRESCGPEIVSDQESGLLADPSSPDDVAEKVLAIVRSPDLAGKLGEAGRARALALFDTRVAVERTIAFYRETVAEERGRKKV